MKNLDLANIGVAPQATGRCDRRSLLLGAGAATLMAGAPGLALAAGGARRFKLFRGDEEVGHHSLTAGMSGDDLTIDIRILIEIRRLGIRLFVYEHQNKETWRGGKLISLVSTTNDDGDKDFCKAARQGGKLQINGSKFSGAIDGDVRPSTYWNYGNLSSTPWFSSQSGEVLKVSLKKGREGGLERWDVTGDFATTLLYDGRGEWRGCRFDAGGTPIVYRQDQAGPSFNALI